MTVLLGLDVRFTVRDLASPRLRRMEGELRAYGNRHGMRLPWGGYARDNLQVHFAMLTGDDE